MAGNSILDCFDGQIYCEEIKENVTKIISSCDQLPRAKQEDNAKKWLTWARSYHHLRTVTADVPHGILPKGLSGRLHDVKVSSRGPDDAIYDKNKEIREKVARGNCILELTGSTNNVRCVTFALKKFTGGLGDDDDRDIGDNHTWKKYFLQPMEAAQSVVCTRKANGEAAHLSATRISGQKFICCGSKNVHMLVKNREDIAKYIGDRYRIASEVCSTIFDVIESLGEEKSNRLVEFLCDTQLTGVFEILSPHHQHVENFSHMTNPEMKFIVWTTFHSLHEDEEQLCCMPPHIAIETARALGLDTVEYEIIPVKAVDHRMNQIRKGYGYEGEVLYFVNDQNAVIGLLKKKTIWYILCRAIREKLRHGMTQNKKNQGTYSVQSSIKKVNSRMNEIQTWLGMDGDSIRKWKEIGVKCMTWAIELQDSGQLDIGDISELFPVTWQRFLDELKLSDRFDMEINTQEEQDIDTCGEKL